MSRYDELNPREQFYKIRKDFMLVDRVQMQVYLIDYNNSAYILEARNGNGTT